MQCRARAKASRQLCRKIYNHTHPYQEDKTCYSYRGSGSLTIRSFDSAYDKIVIMKSSIRISIVSALVVSLILGLVPTASTHAAIAMTFPVIGKASFTNDFDSARGSEKHNAIDIIAGKHQKVVAAVSGTITYVAYPQPSWGYMVRIVAPGGYEFDYIHLHINYQ